MAGEPSVGELVKRASEQLADLVRLEVRTARAELTQKGAAAPASAAGCSARREPSPMSA